MPNSNRNIAFTREQIDKIGNAIIYLSGRVPDLTKTKILKTLFFLEEASIKKYGNPFFGVDFQLWKLGPVPKDIFIDLCDEQPGLLGNYIQRDAQNPGVFKAIKAFADDEFSDNDMELLNVVSDFVQHKTASALVKYTHSANSLWHLSAVKNGVLELLEDQLINSTEFTIDFSILFENNPAMLEKFIEMKDGFEFSKHLKS